MSDLAVEAAELERVRAESESILARHAGRTPGQVRADTDRALVLRGAEAVDYGVSDTVPTPFQLTTGTPELLHPGHECPEHS